MVDQTDLKRPTFDRGGRIQVHVPDGTKLVGWDGRIPEREAPGIFAERHSHTRRLRVLDAYAFSLTAIEVMELVDAEYLLVREMDTGDVYEWKLTALTHGDEVPEEFLEYPSDPQKYVTRDSARAIWRDHPGVIREQEPPADDEGFTKASEMTPEERLEVAYRRGEGGEDDGE